MTMMMVVPFDKFTHPTARIIKRCLEIPGQNLFQYLDENGERHTVSSSDVNAYLQTLTGAERSLTEELSAFEDKVLSARERSLARERFLYEQLLDRLNHDLQTLKACAQALAECDVLTAFAERAEALNWCCPQLLDTDGIRIRRGRHVRRGLRDQLRACGLVRQGHFDRFEDITGLQDRFAQSPGHDRGMRGVRTDLSRAAG